MTELERYKKALALARCNFESMASYTGTFAEQAKNVLTAVDAILNPPPVYEEVTVERWECQKCGRVYMGAIYAIAPCGYNGCNGTDYKPLPFTRRVQVAQKVERSVSVEARINGFGNVFSLNGDSLFSEHPEVHSKTGTLTFMVKE